MTLEGLRSHHRGQILDSISYWTWIKSPGSKKLLFGKSTARAAELRELRRLIDALRESGAGNV